VSFAAKYTGRCNAGDCAYGDHKINQGDEIDYFDDELMHVECAKRAEREDYPICHECWQYHKGECL
jgi:hypothetical protein